MASLVARRGIALLLMLVTASCSAESGSKTEAKAGDSKPVTASPAATAASSNATPAGDAYTTLNTQVPTEVVPGQVEVLEFFLYSCPHCYHFEPLINPWGKKLPGHAVLKRVPANFGPNAALYARAHYAAETLGVLEPFKAALFKAVQDERRTLDNEAALALVFKAATGIDEKKFGEAFNSFAVDNLVRRADALARAYGITGVPGLAVAGKYLITPRQGGYEGMLKTADSLIERERVK